MSRMKHLLRKLHIGGGLNDHQRLTQPHPDPVTIPSPPPPPPPAPTSPPSSSSSTAALTSSALVRTDGVATGAPESSIDFSFFEEEFQVQLALAISASDPGASLEDAETAQIKVAERISLMGSLPSAPNCGTLGESLSLRYWNYNFISYDEKVVDGFYDVYGITENMVQGKMPVLVDLQSISISDNVENGVILVDRSVDLELQELENKAYCISLETGASKLDPILSGLVQRIADLVVCRMGGPVGDAGDILKRWRARSYELHTSLNTIILHLGRLDVGLSRHRALLFKVLADKINLPCLLVKGSYYTGTDEGAVNIIKTGNGSEYIVDLMGAPGALIPAETPSCLLQNFRSDARSSAGVMEMVTDPSLERDNVIRTLAVSPVLDTATTKVGSSKSEYGGTHIKEVDNKIAESSRTERFEQDFGKLLPSLRISRENSLPSSGKVSPAQKMQVNDVSKYVISAAKNPEFAQKLHAVLLESGAAPPPDLFMDMNSEDTGEEKMPDQIELVGRKKVDDGVQCHTTKPVSNNKRHSDPSLPSSTSDGYVLVGCGTTEMLQAGSTVDSCQRQLEIAGYSGDHSQQNAGINPVLGEVAEWEIPWEDLQIGERIGIGSYGEVYRADWNGTEVAVKKFLNQDFFGEALVQFKYEAEIMIRLRHPNVVLFMGAVTRSPNSSILTEFLPRGSLYKLLHRTRIQLDERRRMQMALDVAKGMNYLHTGHPPIVHRDLKSPNLLVGKNWVVKVCDFGLSRLKHHTFLSSKSTAGTAEWMAPEVLRNEPSNEKCDVYSFGVILWELTTLRVPWSGMNPMQVVGAVGFQNRRLEIPEEVDPIVARIILDCWQSEPHLRPSFSQLISRLRHLQRLVVDRT